MRIFRAGGGLVPGKDTAQERREAIREIVARQAVRSQTELVRLLGRKGFTVTQSCVSRDLEELKVVKVDGRYVELTALAAAAPAGDELALAAPFVRAVRPAGPHLLVVLTPPGRAPAVALAIDHARWPEVVGTVAGDDTVMVATTGRREQARVVARLEQLAGRIERLARDRAP